jgi:DNA invertase Pin-like site-specific DNA recombinase
MPFGYTRVSTVAQTLDQQNQALKAAGVSKVFSDTMSGARDDRPGLAALMDQLRPGDTVVVWKLDRLGRNMLHILETVKVLTERGVTLVSTSDGIDSSTAAGRMMIWGAWVARRVRTGVDQGAHRIEEGVVTRERHQVRTASQS